MNESAGDQSLTKDILPIQHALSIAAAVQPVPIHLSSDVPVTLIIVLNSCRVPAGITISCASGKRQKNTANNKTHYQKINFSQLLNPLLSNGYTR